MPITIAFTVTSAIALLVNIAFWTRTLKKRRDLKKSGQNGELKVISDTFVNMWATILISDLMVLIAGIGILAGFRELGYFLAVMPVASTCIGILALYGLLNDN